MARNAVSLKDLAKKDDEAKRQEFFAGGLDNRGGGSGLSVLGPPPSSSSSSSSSSSRAGGPNVFDRIVERAQDSAANSGPPIEGSAGPQRVITMYRNGFVVDDGPFRDLLAPENQSFIRSLMTGMVPAELVPPGQEAGDLEVSLNDKREEDYVPPPPPAYVAFSKGTTLGTSSSSDGAFVATAEAVATVPASEWQVNEGAPSSTLQVKTLDGKRLKIKMNNAATVLQLAAAIRSQGVTEAFILNAGFPPKDVTDSAQTLVDAGLVGASITLKKG